jgi:rhomboid-like protein
VPRYPASGLSYAFGPGPMTPAVKMLVIANVIAFLVSLVVPEIIMRLGLVPDAVFGHFAIWQPITYMFLHSPGGFGHILINMLSLWMFGTELESSWVKVLFSM